MIPILYGKVKDGKLSLDAPQSYLVELSKLEGQRVELTIRKERHVRSLSQNKYYWSVIVEILSHHFGYEPEEMHMALRYKFLQVHDESQFVIAKSTTKLSTVGFSDYIDKITRWASTEHQIVIPSADGIDI